MKYVILVVMMTAPGDKTDFYVYDNMPFHNLEECQSFGQQYWQPLTNLAQMKHRKPWADMFCIPEKNSSKNLIEAVINGSGV